MINSNRQASGSVPVTTGTGRGGIGAVICRGGVLLWLVVVSSAAPPLQGTFVREYVASDPPMRLPTDVATFNDGAVAVADGVHDRVLIFAVDAEPATVVARAAGVPLRACIGVFVDRSDRLFIADTGNQRVVVAARDGRILETIPIALGDDTAVDITDIALSPDGEQLWIVDNDHHRLLQLDLQQRVFSRVGARGASLGQFEYPFLIAATDSTDVLVTDVLNGRVQTLTGDGRPAGALGSYGIRKGTFYYPKGVAYGPRGTVWVSDSVTGVIQAFAPRGSFIDVLRDADGAPVRLESPIGLAFNRDGNLLVVEMRRDRVVEYAIERSAAPPLTAPIRPSIGSGQQSRGCTLCHLDWHPDFERVPRTEWLVPQPRSDSAAPFASTEPMCLACHDGAIDDARRRVWLEHGHRTGVAPPTGMIVPEELPLQDGRMACRTCHTAHRDPQAFSMEKAVMARFPTADLCHRCHSDMGPDAATFGHHPVGPVAVEFHDALQPGHSGALTCAECHTPHGAADHLLAFDPDSNAQCLRCHDGMQPNVSRAHDGVHPFDVRLSDAQLDAIRALGTRVAPDETLLCLSCHRMHGAAERFLLERPLRNSEMCLQCHREYGMLVGSAHDLRTNFPHERNRHGFTSAEGGPCSACHLFHRVAREPLATQFDASGQCATCHQPEGCAASATAGRFSHPGESCTDCHNPHETATAHFLRGPIDEVCSTCHVDHLGLVGGAHDALQFPGAWSGFSCGAESRCMQCHAPHADTHAGRWRVRPTDARTGEDEVCLACHADARWHATGKQSAAHPQTGDLAAFVGNLPLGRDDAGAPRVQCRTCHDPHGGSTAAAHLLRAPRGRSQELCLTCHREQRAIEWTGHAAARLAAAGHEAEACAPCHRMHAPQAQLAERLFPRTMHASAPADADQVWDPTCSSCHSSTTFTERSRVATHPLVPMAFPAVGSVPSALPLYSSSGMVSDVGQIACRTCHLPHGRVDVHGERAAREDVKNAPAQQLHLRPFGVPNACTTCHSTSALQRFLYFHHPDKRTAGLPVGG